MGVCLKIEGSAVMESCANDSVRLFLQGRRTRGASTSPSPSGQPSPLFSPKATQTASGSSRRVPYFLPLSCLLAYQLSGFCARVRRTRDTCACVVRCSLFDASNRTPRRSYSTTCRATSRSPSPRRATTRGGSPGRRCPRASRREDERGQPTLLTRAAPCAAVLCCCKACRCAPVPEGFS